MKKLFLSLLLSVIMLHGFSQCIVQSQSGYFVVVELDAVGIIAPTPPCNGYNYKIQVSYNISFVGNAPSSMDFIKAHIVFNDGSTVPVTLPDHACSGIAVSNSIYRAKSDCDSITISNINISHFKIHIKGIGVNDKAVCGFSPLPIELYTFNCKQTESGVMITWETLSETNNDRFELYGSNDLKKYLHITTIHANNYGSIYNHYLPNNQRFLYYKLVQIDFDGAMNEVAITPCDMWVKASNNVIVDAGAVININEVSKYSVYTSTGILVLSGYGSYIKTGTLSCGWYILVSDFKVFLFGVRK